MFLLLIFSHVLSDFLIQNNKTISLKKQNKWINIGYFRHFIEVLLPMMLLYLIFDFQNTTILIFSVSGIHLFIDFFKKIITNSVKDKNKYKIFILDQMLHIASIFLLIYYLPKPKSININYYIFLISNSEYFKFVIVLIYVVIFGGYLIQSFLAGLRLSPIKSTDLILSESNVRNPNMGRYIGMLERFILLFLMLNGQYAGVGLVLITKSIARFKQLENKEFAEYYLIGSLLSIAITIVGVFVFKSIIW